MIAAATIGQVLGGRRGVALVTDTYHIWLLTRQRAYVGCFGVPQVDNDLVDALRATDAVSESVKNAALRVLLGERLRLQVAKLVQQSDLRIGMATTEHDMVD